MCKYVLMLDDKSKQFVRLDNSILNAESVTIVNTLYEINDKMLDDERVVIVLEGAVRVGGNLSLLRLYKELMHLKYVFLCSDDSINFIIGDLGKCYKCDLTILDIELMQASIFDDKSFVNDKDVFTDSKKYAEDRLKGDITKDERNLLDNYLACLDRQVALEKKLQEQSKQLESLSRKNDSLSADNRRWFNGCKTLVARAKKLDSMLARYEAVFTKDAYYKLKLHDFQDRPTIVYLKAFTEFDGLELLLQTLTDAFRLQLDRSVKVVRLYDSSGNRAIRLLPDHYKVLRNHYTINEVMQNDFLCKSGEYANLLERLLTNRYGLNVLIIVDLKDYDDVVLDGSYLRYYLCKNVDQARIFGLPQDYTILNEPDKVWTSWTPLNTSGYSRQEAFMKLSSRKIIRDIVTGIDKYTNAF